MTQGVMDGLNRALRRRFPARILRQNREECPPIFNLGVSGPTRFGTLPPISVPCGSEKQGRDARILGGTFQVHRRLEKCDVLGTTCVVLGINLKVILVMLAR